MGWWCECTVLQVIDDLFNREVNGYTAILVPIYKWNPEEGSTDDDSNLITKTGLTFQAGIDNKCFSGFLNHEEIAERIMTCRGDAGANLDYLLNLHDALNKLGMKDEHVSDIAERIEQKQNAK